MHFQEIAAAGRVGGLVKVRRVASIAGAVWAVAAVMTSGSALAQVSVLQVEPGIASGLPTYSPVEFGSATTVTGSSVGFPGITSFTTLLTPASSAKSYSIHAYTAGTNFYGPGTIGATAIDKVYVDSVKISNASGGVSSWSFLTNILKIGTTSYSTESGTAYNLAPSAGNVGPLPAVMPFGIKVSNHAYVNQDLNSTVNAELTRRADFMIDRDNHVWVAGAVTGSQFVGGDGTTSMAWQVRNGIAVRGDAGQTPFNPNLGNAGRRHADVWGSGAASYSSASIAGQAAALVNRGIQLNNTAAQDARVIKSVMMTGADKTIQAGLFNQSGPSWQPSTQNNLDPQGGAGKADYNASLAIINAGQRTYASATGSVAGSTISAGGTVSSSTAGWALGSISAGSSSVVLVHFNGALNRFAATLNWNWTTMTLGNNILTGDNHVINPDLAFDLRPVTWNGSQYVMGSTVSSVTGRSLVSDATGTNNDNVEHLYLNSNAIGPGTYALVVRGDSSLSTSAALSYTATLGSTPTWQTDTNSTFGTGSNWAGSFAPNGVSTSAVFPNVISAARTVDVAANTTLGSVTFSASNTYTLSSSNGSSLTLTNGAMGPAVVSVTSGAPVIDLPVIAPNNTTVAFSGTGTALTARSLANAGQLNISGAGTLRVNQTVSGSGSIVVGEGSSLLVSNAGSSSTSVRVLEQASLTLAGTSVNPALATIAGEAMPTSGDRPLKPRVSVLGTLSIANNGAPLGSREYYGTLDLQNNDLIVRGTTEATVRDMVASWWNGGARDGTGLGSSIAGTGTGVDELTTLAVVSNNNGSGGVRFSEFDNVAGLTTSDVLVKYTYIGDTNLSGRVDADDLQATIMGIRNGLTGWWNGDTNYDGVVDANDLANVLRIMSLHGASLGDTGGTSAGGAIPEPGSMALLLAAAPLGLRRRRA